MTLGAYDTPTFSSTVLLCDPRQVSLPLCASFSNPSKGARKLREDPAQERFEELKF